MRTIKNISIVIAVLLALFVVIGLFLPSKWEVSRSLAMSASKQRIYDEVANLQNWLKWSPWTGEKDQTLKYSYEGPMVGAGAQQNWTSEKMGNGWLKIVEANVEEGIKYDLFIEMGPFSSNILGSMSFDDMGEETNVIWTDKGDYGNNILKKWMALAMGSMLGKDLETGLKSLKELVEKEEAPNNNDGDAQEHEQPKDEEAQKQEEPKEE